MRYSNRYENVLYVLLFLLLQLPVKMNDQAGFFSKGLLLIKSHHPRRDALLGRAINGNMVPVFFLQNLQCLFAGQKSNEHIFLLLFIFCS